MAVTTRDRAAPTKPKSAPQKALEKLGLTRDIDLALHLPLRYEDETRLVPVASLHDGESAQVEVVVRDCQVQFRPRQQLVVRAMDDAGDELVLRFLHFYPSHQRALAVGQRVRVRGDVRGGFLGLEMVHPSFKAVSGDTPLASALTPVYPTSASLPQAYLRKAVASGLQRADLSEIVPAELVPQGMATFREALRFLHEPSPATPLADLEDKSHPAWQRLKFEELLAQQLSQLQARRERERQRAPRFDVRAGGLQERLLAALPFSLTAAQRRVIEEIAHDLQRPAPDARSGAGAGAGEPDARTGTAGARGNADGGACDAVRSARGDADGSTRTAGGTADVATGHERGGGSDAIGNGSGADSGAMSHGCAAAGEATPMHRLLQGDVGSGKTVVAALAAAIAIEAGWQCALMAPTEILAEQHFRKLIGWLTPLGIGVAWLTGSRKGKARREMIARVASGEAALVVGTHAVIQDEVVFARLGLAIIDEQHRFGVQQRLALRRKLAAPVEPVDLVALFDVDGPVERAGAFAAPEPAAAVARAAAAERAAPVEQLRRDVAHGRGSPTGPRAVRLEPHLLMMSATPIPRTLAMTLFADLDISTIDELPPGRTPIVTKVFADGKRDAVIARIRDEVAQGRQVYWVCPLIEESEHLDLQDATATHRQLCDALPGTMVGLLHGRMPAGEKAAAMSLFEGGQMAVLVSTTVIEVGVDVPNASLMVIEHAERFGLSQLHQLRGRVGRGAVASVCVLLYSGPLSDTGKSRLKAMAETTDGFEIARRDLDIRGPGEFLGARQSGAPLLRFADLSLDQDLVLLARRAAERMLDAHPQEAERHVARWLGGRSDFLKA